MGFHFSRGTALYDLRGSAIKTQSVCVGQAPPSPPPSCQQRGAPSCKESSKRHLQFFWATKHWTDEWRQNKWRDNSTSSPSVLFLEDRNGNLISTRCTWRHMEATGVKLNVAFYEKMSRRVKIKCPNVINRKWRNSVVWCDVPERTAEFSMLTSHTIPPQLTSRTGQDKDNESGLSHCQTVRSVPLNKTAAGRNTPKRLGWQTVTDVCKVPDSQPLTWCVPALLLTELICKLQFSFTNSFLV